jgi:beta-phosphoglucomutase family hydrolase
VDRAEPLEGALSDDRLEFFDAAAVLFDLDGVITPTAEVHMRAWSTMFTALFTQRGVEPPYSDDDYFQHLDGRPRYDGVASLLASRGIDVPMGDPDDPDDADTVCGIGNRKNAVFSALLEQEGIAAYPGSLAVLDRLGMLGIPVAIVSSSKNAVPVLAAANLGDRFPVIVDGVVAHEEGLPGKPQPDIFLEGAKRLQVDPANAVVVEDAISGVAAGASGRFGLVVGVDRGVGSQALRDAGADLVVGDLADLLAGQKGDPQ